MRKALFVFTLLLQLTSLQAQNNEKRQLSPFLVLDTYQSFIGNKSADVFGFRGGVEWNHLWRFGAGYNKISADIIEYKTLPSSEIPFAKNDTVKAQLYLTYYPVMAEYIFFRQDPWQMSIPFQIGYGKSYFQYFDINDKGRKIFSRGVMVSQTGLNAQYKIIRWVGVTAGVGYRIMLKNNPEIETQMNSPVFAVGIKIFLGEVVKSIRGEE